MRITRRRWLRAAVAAASAAIAAAAGSLIADLRAVRGRASRRSVVIPAGEGVVFDDEVIVVRSQGDLRAFSSRCSHLGCRVDRASGGELICPCHGSRFDLDGRPSRGPAAERLRRLEVRPRDGDPRDGDPRDGDPRDGDSHDGDSHDGDSGDRDPRDGDSHDRDERIDVDLAG